MKKFLYTFIFATFMTLEATAQMRLQHGDLLFNITDTTSASDFAKGIVGSTVGIDKARVSHVAILCKEQDKWCVLEATSKHGVRMTTLDNYIAEADKDAEGKPMVLVGRVNDNVDISQSIANAKAFIGCRYDFTFDPSDEEMYCSELVQKSFVDTEGNLIFQPIPMSFHDAEGRILPYWINYYLERDLDVPEGEPGSNPGALSRNEKVEIIGSLH